VVGGIGVGRDAVAQAGKGIGRFELERQGALEKAGDGLGRAVVLSRLVAGEAVAGENTRGGLANGLVRVFQPQHVGVVRSAPGVGVNDGRMRTSVSISVTAGAQKASTARSRPGMAWPRAVRRGLQNMRIQAFLTAATVNLRRLAAAQCALFWSFLNLLDGPERLLEPRTAAERRHLSTAHRTPPPDCHAALITRVLQQALPAHLDRCC
jgi:hypothetical protein